MKNSWQLKPFENCITPVEYTRKIQRKDFLDDGQFPIVSQEAAFINGYWDNEADVFKVSTPVIIFGDHTKVLKYVDFDFVLGADGVKILKPREFFYPKFFFYHLRAANMPSMGYARHYRILKELHFFIPPLSEQRRIVAILDEAFAGIAAAKEKAEQNLKNAKEVFESVISSIEGEKVNLGDYVEIKTGKLDANAAVENGKYPFFTCSREIFSINDFSFDCEAILLAGNNAIGDFNVKYFNGKFNAYQRTYVITANKRKKILCKYLYFQLLNSLKKFKEKSVGAATKFLKLGMIKEMKISLPSLSEQEVIISRLSNIQDETENLESIYLQKLSNFEELKKSVLQQAFSGAL